MKKLTILAGALALGATIAHAANDKSQAGGLPALEARVAALEALLGNGSGDSDVYSGTYSVIMLESNKFGCGAGNEPFSNSFPSYASLQGVSSVTTNTALMTAVSDGEMITFPDHLMERQELRLSGTYENDSFVDDGFSLAISSCGGLAIPGAADFIGGQMSADGSSFHALARFENLETEDLACTDAGTILLMGVRI